MIDLKQTLTQIEASDEILDDMIVKAEEQGAKNFDMLYTLKKGLGVLSKQLLNKQSISDSFLNEWDVIMGWAPRVFEGHPLLERLRKIDDFVISKKF